MCAKRTRGVGGMDEMGEGDKEIKTSKFIINKSQFIKDSTGNIVNNIIVTLCGDIWQ